jgi:hypothetical protein
MARPERMTDERLEAIRANAFPGSLAAMYQHELVVEVDRLRALAGTCDHDQCPGCAGDLAGIVDASCPRCRAQLFETYGAMEREAVAAYLRREARRLFEYSGEPTSQLTDAADAIMRGAHRSTT